MAPGTREAFAGLNEVDRALEFEPPWPEGMDVPMRLETTDVSLGGCYVEMAFTLDIGTKLDMVFWLGAQKIVTAGIVVTRHPQIGNGIEFKGMSSHDRDMLRRFQDSLEASHALSGLIPV